MSCSLSGVLPTDGGNVSCTPNNGSFADKNAGSWNVTATVTISGPAAGNYTLGAAGSSVNSTSANATASITPAPVTATGGGYTGVFDGTAHSPSACVVTGTSPNTFIGPLTCTDNPSSVGPHVSSGSVAPSVSFNGDSSSNYTITPVNGSYNITPAPVTATAGSYTGVYDALSHSPSVCAVTGAYKGALTCTNNPTSVGPNAGSGTVTPTVNPNGDLLTDYTVTPVSGSWSITPAPLTITSDSKSMILDGALPTFTVTYNGFVGSQGPSVLSGVLSCSAGTNGQTVGTFTINCGGQTSTNYAISYLNTGKLTVTYALAGGICDGDLGHSILQPINVNGTSVFNQKSTSPAKFRVCDANGVSIGTPGVVQSFVLYQTINGTLTSSVNEAVDSTTPDSMFRWDSTAQQWIFNISNKNLGPANQTYFFRITLNDGSTILFNYGLK
jgi:hypothetical protein